MDLLGYTDLNEEDSFPMERSPFLVEEELKHLEVSHTPGKSRYRGAAPFFMLSH